MNYILFICLCLHVFGLGFVFYLFILVANNTVCSGLGVDSDNVLDSWRHHNRSTHIYRQGHFTSMKTKTWLRSVISSKFIDCWHSTFKTGITSCSWEAWRRKCQLAATEKKSSCVKLAILHKLIVVVASVLVQYFAFRQWWGNCLRNPKTLRVCFMVMHNTTPSVLFWRQHKWDPGSLFIFLYDCVILMRLLSWQVECGSLINHAFRALQVDKYK